MKPLIQSHLFSNKSAFESRKKQILKLIEQHDIEFEDHENKPQVRFDIEAYHKSMDRLRYEIEEVDLMSKLDYLTNELKSMEETDLFYKSVCDDIKLINNRLKTIRKMLWN